MVLPLTKRPWFLCRRSILIVRLIQTKCEQKPPTSKPFASIPGPLSLPFVGTLYQYLPIFGRYKFNKLEVNGLKKMQLYGEIVREEIVPGTNVVWIFDPADIEKLFHTEKDSLPMRRSHLALEKYRLDRPHIYNTAGLIPTNGDDWVRLRKVFQKGLLTLPDIQSFLVGSDVIVQEWIEKLEEFPATKDYLPLLSRLFLELIGFATMDIRFGSFSYEQLKRNSRTSKLIRAAFTTNSAILKTDNGPQLWRKFETPLFRKLKKSQQYMERMAIDIVSTKMAFDFRDCKDQTMTLLEKYLSSPQLDFKDIVGVICDFLLAGMDTTAYTTSFLLYYVAKHPEVQQKLYEESLRALPNTFDPVTAQALSKVPYAKAVLKETLRLRPISVGIGRILSKDLVLSGYTIPKGTTVVTQNQVICRLDKYFEKPNEFIPERWLKSKSHPYLSLPFGHGFRQCIARRLAEQNMILLLLKLSRNYEITWKGRDIDTKSLLINVPDGPISLAFNKRKK